MRIVIAGNNLTLGNLKSVPAVLGKSFDHSRIKMEPKVEGLMERLKHRIDTLLAEHLQDANKEDLSSQAWKWVFNVAFGPHRTFFLYLGI